MLRLRICPDLGQAARGKWDVVNARRCADAHITLDYRSVAGAYPPTERMKRSRFKRNVQRRLAFRNRQAAISTILGHLGASREDAGYLRVISLVGLGGAGKTRLLDEITTQASARYADIEFVRVNLEAESVGTALAPLKAIRDQLKFDCMLFDCAIVIYWAAMGLPFRLVQGGALSKSFVVRAIEAGVGLTGLSLPLSFAGDMFERGKRKIRRKQLYEKSEFDEIDRLRDSPSELLERLPFCLGKDIDKHFSGREQQKLVLYDSYEKQSRIALKAKSAWLREFIGTLDSGVHIIASREPLRWPHSTWGDVLTEIVVDALPESDCREMIQSEINAQAAVVDKIVRVSHCIPFFVEALLNAYQTLKTDRNIVDVSLLPGTEAEATAFLIRHLPSQEQEILTALATLQFFDEVQYRLLVRALNIPISFASFYDICSLFFVETYERAEGVFKVHDIVSDFVRNEPTLQNSRVTAIHAASRILALRANTDESVNRILPHFSGLIGAICGNDPISTQAIEAIVDVGYRLYDIGLWRELISLAEHGNLQTSKSGEVVALFFKALSLRRTNSIHDAEQLLSALQINRARLGKHALSIDLELAYLREIAGHYSEARERFATLYLQCKPFDPTDRTHVRSLLYHADMLIMDGSFNQGSDILLVGTELLEVGDRLNLAEFVRHRGHAFRNSILFDEAIALYLKALSSVSDVPSMKAKLIGNLAECQCWNDPELAIESARFALELNGQLGNVIEVGKNHTALSLAYSMLGSVDAAEAHSRLARSSAENIGYSAGILFSELASCIVAARTAPLFHKRVKQLQMRVETLGTYRHLLLIPLLISGDEEMVRSVVVECAWIEPDTIIQRAQSIATRIKATYQTSGDQ